MFMGQEFVNSLPGCTFQAIIKVLVGAIILISGSMLSSMLTSGWKNSFPCGCMAEVSVLLLAVTGTMLCA